MSEQSIGGGTPKGRWRVRSEDGVSVTGTKLEERVTVSVAEFYVGQVREGLAQVRVVRAGDARQQASWQITISEKDLTSLVEASVPEPDLLPDHNVIGGYFAPGTTPFVADPHPSDVTQGLLGDCRVASAFQAVAAARGGPALLRSVIASDDGGYTVTLRRTTGPKTVPPTTQKPEAFAVGAYLPVNRATREPLYVLSGVKLGPSATVSLWPAILEKAFAQMWGGYAALTGAEEMPVFAALGLTEQSRVNMMSSAAMGVPAAIKQIITLAEGGYALTTAAMAARHNYAIVGVDKDGVVVSDPNTPRGGEAESRWKSPQTMKEASSLPKAASFPLHFTWEAFFETFMWVYAARVPAKK